MEPCDIFVIHLPGATTSAKGSQESVTAALVPLDLPGSIENNFSIGPHTWSCPPSIVPLRSIGPLALTRVAPSFAFSATGSPPSTGALLWIGPVVSRAAGNSAFSATGFPLSTATGFPLPTALLLEHGQRSAAPRIPATARAPPTVASTTARSPEPRKGAARAAPAVSGKSWARSTLAWSAGAVR